MAAAFRQMLARQGVDDVRGVELLRLVRAANNAYEAILDESLAGAGITHHRWRVLLRIWQAEEMGQPAVNPTELSRAQQVSRNTISDHLRSLEEAGLIVRELNPDDRRQFKIGLTEAGRAIVRNCTPIQVRFLNQLVAGIEDAEIDQLMLLLERLHRRLLHNAQVIEKCPPAAGRHA